MNQKGFSMIELAVAVSIMGILVSMAIPNYIQQTANQRLKDDITNIRGDLQMARMAAMANNSAVVVNFDVPAAGQYQMFLDNGVTGGTARNSMRDGCEPFLDYGGRPLIVMPCEPVPNGVTRALYEGIGIAAVPPNGTITISFAPSGSRNSDVTTIALSNDYGINRTIAVTPIGEVGEAM